MNQIVAVALRVTLILVLDIHHPIAISIGWQGQVLQELKDLRVTRLVIISIKLWSRCLDFIKILAVNLISIWSWHITCENIDHYSKSFCISLKFYSATWCIGNLLQFFILSGWRNSKTFGKSGYLTKVKVSLCLSARKLKSKTMAFIYQDIKITHLSKW